jgi:hypothetical protein
MPLSPPMLRKYRDGVRLARMSSGTWCLVRDLGLVKGGKGMRHFEPIMTFSVRALGGYLRGAFSRDVAGTDEVADSVQDLR